MSFGDYLLARLMTPQKCAVNGCYKICDWYWVDFCEDHICYNYDCIDTNRIYFTGSKYCPTCWKERIWKADSLLYDIPREIRENILTYFQENVIKDDNWTKLRMGSMASESSESSDSSDV